jgi:hypothetical protein
MQRRADVLRKVIADIVQNPDVAVTTHAAADILRVQLDAAERIIDRLVASGVLREARRGVWVRARR